ncbi:peptidoglycan/LPS O-acetylase OafA/YrhL [Lipingzhangella halophila]|uniref:Peptidoglycan/LPS O-acetylase OafA/YrhL n=1 Tax=Lipingzhangella halophila TaxID=1783352 RepID=A0A7W7RHC9_9ACTN|nr:acyltransferase family protein [Lipingzhangella halophila]MBB4931912.1 peptidoglycan/LPS O-acetylase OafA/YrhL [Lipingzhangella halophila]
MATRLRTEAARSAPQPPPPTQRRFFPEVQGLRALAVAIVLAYHVNHDLLPGGYVGVDVFFVISGFLITTLMLREARTHGRVSLAGFYIRRVRRILPAATLVLVVTGVLALVVLPSPRLADTAAQLLASAAYVENLFLAHQSVDYLAAEAAASPVRHFWSLAVEEQFYLLWPLLFAGWLALSPRWRGETVIIALTSAVVAVSFGWSVWLTTNDPQPAYFLPQGRMWELAAGGVLALLLARWQPPESARWPLGWAGIAAIAAAAIGYDATTPFPGWAATLPVLGTIAVITAGHTAGRWSAYALLSTRPAGYVGDLSYALYLWHWPLIVFTLARTERPALNALEAVLVLGATFALAWGTKAALEDPLRAARLPRGGRGAAAFALTGLLLVTAIGAGKYAYQQELSDVRFDPEVHVGPQAIGQQHPEGDDSAIYPPPVSATADLPGVYDDDCHATPSVTTLKSCVYGPDDATTDVAIVGDSHAAHWVPALREVAHDREWRLHTYTKSSCPFTDTLAERNGGPYRECEQWNEAVRDELVSEVEPETVFTSSATQTRAHHADTDEQNTAMLAGGMAGLWSSLDAAGIDVAAIRDTPKSRARLPECVDRNPDDLDECARTSGEALAEDDPQELAVAEYGAQADLLDLTDRFCADGRCPPVVGNVLVYRDSNHLTAAYSRLLASDLQERL